MENHTYMDIIKSYHITVNGTKNQTRAISVVNHCSWLSRSLKVKSNGVAKIANTEVPLSAFSRKMHPHATCIFLSEIESLKY